MELSSISELIEELRAGRMVILVDDEDRENEGDLVIAADYITPQAVNFMALEARGLICLALTEKQIGQLGLPLMVKEDFNRAPNRTAFTVSIEAARGVSTGISATDRAMTIKVASNPKALPSDIIVPGHVFPIRAQDGGVLKRAGHTEASVDLVRLSGLNPAAVICEIMNSDGSMARVPDLIDFARKHKLKVGAIEDLIKYRLQNETFVEEVAEANFPCDFGHGFRVRLFHNNLDGRDHLAFVKGDLSGNDPVLVRVQSECVVGDVFGSEHNRSGAFLKRSMELINSHGRGVLIYLRMEDMLGRLREQIQAYSRLDSGEAESAEIRSDGRDYGVGAQILRALGLRKICLLTNNPEKRVGLKGYGIEIVDTIPLTLDSQRRGLSKPAYLLAEH